MLINKIDMRYSAILAFILFAISSFGCKPAEILLHGDVAGIVTDATNKLPVQDASIKLNTSNDSTTTGIDGAYLFKHLTPGEYEIQASSSGYAVSKQNVVLASAETKQIDFSLNGIPVPKPSVSFLDFGLDSVSLRFTISNNGKGNFSYNLASSADWITISPHNGDVSNESRSINVNINRTGLSNSIYKENIKVSSFAGQVPLQDIIIPVYLNGARDEDGNYYKVIRIGTQIWMAENINVGIELTVNDEEKDNGIIEKYCYADSKANCDIYGGLYKWNEMMQYNAPDNGLIGTTRGICPVGWHIPTENEWVTLYNYLGGLGIAGGKLKETGTKYWWAPNVGASDAVGFSGLPGAYLSIDSIPFAGMGMFGGWWTSTDRIGVTHDPYFFYLYYDGEFITREEGYEAEGRSVRCAKNPAK
jgi:uncharacterized protein (TIGR02145 family)